MPRVAAVDPVRVGDSVTIGVSDLDGLIRELAARGYETIGPTVRDGAVVPGPVSSVGQLPRGVHDEQAPGSYRLRHEGDDELFGWAVGPASYKGVLFPAEETLWRARRDGQDVVVDEVRDARPPLAIVGARPCELAALEVLDRVLLGGPVVDDRYAARREEAFVLVAECGKPAATCFCTSMGTGPAAGASASVSPSEPRFDLAIAEIVDDEPGAAGERPDAGAPVSRDVRVGRGHRFVVTVGSERGASLLEHVAHVEASAADRAARAGVLARAAAQMGRSLDTDGLAPLLARNIDSPRWQDVAQRCLSCGNCTMVCPTCFCTDVDDVTDLTGAVERRRHWASCFDLGHSFMHGGPVRSSAASRYRQWATHKLSTWHDQFGTSGCVGCGRCIAWCPVGIDITEEAAAIRASDVEAAGAGQTRGER